MQNELRQNFGYLNQEVQAARQTAEQAAQAAAQAAQPAPLPRPPQDIAAAGMELRDRWLTNPMEVEGQRMQVVNNLVDQKLAQKEQERASADAAKEQYNTFWQGFYNEFPHLSPHHATILEIYNGQPQGVRDPNQRAMNAAQMMNQTLAQHAQTQKEAEARKSGAAQAVSTGASGAPVQELAGMFNPHLGSDEQMDSESATLDRAAAHKERMALKKTL
jgi:hypothetical protein